MGRPKGSKNKPKGSSAGVEVKRRGRPAAVAAKRPGRPPGSGKKSVMAQKSASPARRGRKPRQEAEQSVSRHEVVLTRTAEAAEATTMLLLVDRVLRLEESARQQNVYVQQVVTDVNKAFALFEQRLEGLVAPTPEAKEKPVNGAPAGANGATLESAASVAEAPAKRGRPAKAKAEAKPAEPVETVEEDSVDEDVLEDDDVYEEEELEETNFDI